MKTTTLVLLLSLLLPACAVSSDPTGEASGSLTPTVEPPAETCARYCAMRAGCGDPPELCEERCLEPAKCHETVLALEGCLADEHDITGECKAGTCRCVDELRANEACQGMAK